MLRRLILKSLRALLFIAADNIRTCAVGRTIANHLKVLQFKILAIENDVLRLGN